MTYADLRDRTVELAALADRTKRRLFTLTPGTPEGRRVYRLLTQIETAHAASRRAMLNHPDAPPQG